MQRIRLCTHFSTGAESQRTGVEEVQSEEWRGTLVEKGEAKEREWSAECGEGGAADCPDGARLWWHRPCNRWPGVALERQSEAVVASSRYRRFGELLRGGRQPPCIVDRVIRVRGGEEREGGATSHCRPQVSHNRWSNEFLAGAWTMFSDEFLPKFRAYLLVLISRRANESAWTGESLVGV